MSYATLILGESGTGKTASLRNFDPAKTLLIQPTRKPLPFRSKNWREGKGGNIYVCSDVRKIVDAMRRAPHEIIVIDDFQYLLIGILMNRRNERSFDKFSDIAGAGYDIVTTASQLDEHKRVYILCHTDTDEFGVVRAKSIGKMLSEKICVEGLFTITLRTHVENGNYTFSTQNSGNDTVKSPIGLFEQRFIDNDLNWVDQQVVEYYGINEEAEQTEE